MARVLGIDYGEKRVGIAVSDDALTMAFPRLVMENTNTLVEAIATLADAEDIDSFVVGESDNPAGGENRITHRITIFGKALQVRTGKNVFFVSEAYTSAEARRALELGMRTRKDAVHVVDAAAAALILQTYLDTQHKR